MHAQGVFECTCLDDKHSEKKLITAVVSIGLAAVGLVWLKLTLGEHIWRAAPGVAWRAAVGVGVGITSVVPSVWLAFVGSNWMLTIHAISALKDGFFVQRSEQRALFVEQLHWPLAAYMAPLLSVPLVTLHCAAFRFLKWWPRVMASVAGLVAACGILYLQHLSEEQHKLEQLLDTMTRGQNAPRYKTRALRALGRLCNGAKVVFLAVVMAVGADEQIREKLRDTRGENPDQSRVSRASII